MAAVNQTECVEVLKNTKKIIYKKDFFFKGKGNFQLKILHF